MKENSDMNSAESSKDGKVICTVEDGRELGIAFWEVIDCFMSVLIRVVQATRCKSAYLRRA
jgi:hypothetical protein